jgi:hypothetical protein
VTKKIVRKKGHPMVRRWIKGLRGVCEDQKRAELVQRAGVHGRMPLLPETGREF